MALSLIYLTLVINASCSKRDPKDDGSKYIGEVFNDKQFFIGNLSVFSPTSGKQLKIQNTLICWFWWWPAEWTLPNTLSLLYSSGIVSCEVDADSSSTVICPSLLFPLQQEQQEVVYSYQYNLLSLSFFYSSFMFCVFFPRQEML